jgi:endonuclease G
MRLPVDPGRRDHTKHAVVPVYDTDFVKVLLSDGSEESVVFPEECAPVFPEESGPTTRKVTLARAAVEKLRSMRMPTKSEAAALEQIIRERRPALGIVGGVVESWPQGAQVLGERWGSFVARVVPLLAAVGRIESRNDPIGTGFVVADRIVATNKHVVEQLFREGNSLTGAGIRFGLTTEHAATSSFKELVEVIIEHETLDIALLKLGPDGRSPAPLALAATTKREPVVCVGYPFADYRDPAFANKNFAGNFALETLAPGRITRTGKAGFSDLEHDCQTLGGNSGSPLLSVATRAVVAVHYDGKFLERNSAVPIRAVRELLAEIGA